VQVTSTSPTEAVNPPRANPAQPTPPDDSRWDGLLWPAVLCLIVLLALLAATVALWRHEMGEVRAEIRSNTTLLSAQLIERFETGLDERFQPLRNLEVELRSSSGTTLTEFQREAGKLVDGCDWLRAAALVNPKLFCRAAVIHPGVSSKRQHLGRTPIVYPRYYERLKTAQQTGVETIAGYPDGDGGGAEAVFVIPVKADAGRPEGGAILYDISLEKLLAPILEKDTIHSFAISLDNGQGQPIYVISHEPADDALAVSGFAHVADKQWRLTLRPTLSSVADREQRTPTGVLLGGVLISFTLTAGLWQAIVHRQRDRRMSEAHLAALSALNDISLAITADPAATHEVFDALTRTACDLMGMSSASITLLDPADQTMHVLHRHNMHIDPDRAVYRLDELPMSKQCMESKQVLFAQDIWKNPGPFNTERYKSFNIRSIVVVPFLAQDKPLGVMVLSDAKGKKFTSAQRHMAALWGAQAAVTLSNQRLYKGMNDALGAQERLLEQLKMLYEMNTRIQSAETLRESLQLIADLSPRTLGVDCTIVVLHDKDNRPGFVHVGAATKGTSAEQFIGSEMPSCIHCSQVLQTGKPLTVESASGDPILRETVLASWGSAVFLPLATSNNAPFGLLILMRTAPVPLSPEELRIAELFATRAAVVIENTRLYEQTRRDADAKAMLLRELNHRVKNNLAAIVGLLSTKPADLSRSAQRWIDRATQRIATMARTHDLFSGGISEVSVQELAQKALASVEAIKPPGVRIRTELEDLKAELSTDRAVTLAMVLYELCCNALVHGMGESGQLVLRGRNIDGDRVAIEVIDSGSATGALATGKAMVRDDADPRIHPTNGDSHGIGLSLVKGLVGRELHGRFDLRPNPSGGSTATVEFPINGKAPPRV
jgi:two-component sensor histidine kinase